MPKILLQNETSLCIKPEVVRATAPDIFQICLSIFIFRGKKLPSFVLTNYRWLRSADSKNRKLAKIFDGNFFEIHWRVETQKVKMASTLESYVGRIFF